MARTILRSKRSRDGQVASVWENMGMLEETVYQREEQWAGEVQKFKDMEASLASAGLRCFNKPNLLKQNFWTNNSALGKNVVYGQNSRIGGSTHPYLSSYNKPTEYTQTTEPTAEELAECCAYFVNEVDGVTTYHLYKDEDDIKATVADLAAADQITELDGDVYSKAIQYAITANTAWGNAEWLMYYLSQTNKYKQGDSCREYGQIPEMIPGEKYTVSVWARVISGDGALIRFSWGGTHNNTPFNQEGKCVVSDPIEVKGSAWARYSWTFTFNPQGDWYTETSEDVEGVTWITRNYNWNKRVAFGVLRKWNSVIQLTGFRLVAGRMWVTDTWDDIGDKIDQYTGRIDDLGDKIDQYTGRIDDLDTEVAKKADKANTELTGPVSMGRKAGSPAGIHSLAMGDDAVAGGDGSAAQGIGVVTYTNGGRAFGSYNAVPTRNVAEYEVDHAYAVGDYARYWEYAVDPDTQQLVPEKSIVEIYRCKEAHTSVEIWPDTDKWQQVARITLAEYSGKSVPEDLLEAVGNGTGDGARSNARTLDRDGNETLAGGLTLGMGTTDETTITATQLKALLALLS